MGCAAGGHCPSYVPLYDTPSTPQSAPLHPNPVPSLYPMEEGVPPWTGHLFLGWGAAPSVQHHIPPGDTWPVQHPWGPLVCVCPSKASELFAHLRAPRAPPKSFEHLWIPPASPSPQHHCWRCPSCHSSRRRGCGHSAQGRQHSRRSEGGFMPFFPTRPCPCVSGFTPRTERRVTLCRRLWKYFTSLVFLLLSRASPCPPCSAAMGKSQVTVALPVSSRVGHSALSLPPQRPLRFSLLPVWIQTLISLQFHPSAPFLSP